MSLARRKPIAKKRVKPRRRAAGCSVARCKARPQVEGLCRTHATRRADRLVGDFVKARDGGCVAKGHHNGSLQWAHIVSRRYRAVRWDPDNAVALCAAHHMSFTVNPLAWDVWVEQRIGADAYRLIKQRALTDDPADVREVLKKFGGHK